MCQSAFKGTKAEWREVYGGVKCLQVTGENETNPDFRTFDSTVALDDSQSYWRTLLTNLCSEEWFDEFILSGSELPSSAHAGVYLEVAYLSLLGLFLHQM